MPRPPASTTTPLGLLARIVDPTGLHTLYSGLRRVPPGRPVPLVDYDGLGVSGNGATFYRDYPRQRPL